MPSSLILVSEPEDIKAGLVARNKLLIGEFAPAVFRAFVGVPRGFALVAVLGIVALDEIRQILKPHRFLFESVVDVRPVIVIPALKERERDDREDEIARLKSKLGEITMDWLPEGGRDDEPDGLAFDVSFLWSGAGKAEALNQAQTTLSAMPSENEIVAAKSTTNAKMTQSMCGSDASVFLPIVLCKYLAVNLT
jgi:hypothetical protein